MIKEEYVTFETAMLLYHCGFDANVSSVYFVANKEFRDGYRLDDYNKYNQRHKTISMISAPTQALAMRWLREEKGMYILLGAGKWTLDPEPVWQQSACHKSMFMYDADLNHILYATYEQAAEAGIKAACEYLIKQKIAKYNEKNIKYQWK